MNAATAGQGFPAVLNRRVILGGACWAISIVFFIGQAVVMASARNYSIQTNLLSDLGNTSCGPQLCVPLHTLMNGVFILCGLLHWAGAAAILWIWPGRPLARVAAVLLALAGWGLAYAGVFPENVAPINHAFGALIGLFSLNVGMLVLAVTAWPASKPVAMLTLAAGVLGALGLLMFFTDASSLARGLTERLADYPGAATIVVLGLVILVRARAARSV